MVEIYFWIIFEGRKSGPKVLLGLMSFVNAERNALAHVKSVINYERIKNVVECCLNFGLKAEMALFGIIEKNT